MALNRRLFCWYLLAFLTAVFAYGNRKEGRNMKKYIILLLSVLALAGCAAKQKTDEELMAEGWVKNPLENGYEMAATELPTPIDTTKTYKNAEQAEVACEEGNYAAGCSAINSTNLHEYLNREDVLYIDLRDYPDYAKKHLRNFEVIPYFAYIFNADAGTEGKPQLYGGTVDAPIATYEESLELMEALFPKDKTIFLMCQSGGRVAQAMKLLESLGWDMTKIYNVGGMGQYTDEAYGEWTTDTAELTLTPTYNFEGLTPAK